jgi:hypothetical protein
MHGGVRCGRTGAPRTLAVVDAGIGMKRSIPYGFGARGHANRLPCARQPRPERATVPARFCQGQMRPPTGMTDTAPQAAPLDPADLLRDRRYVVFLIFGAIVGVPVAVFSYFSMKTVDEGNQFFFTDLPKHLGFQAEPLWWPLLPLAAGGLLVALAVRFLPGAGDARLQTGSNRLASSRPTSYPGSWWRRSPRSAWAAFSARRHRSSPSGAGSERSSSTF